MKKILLLCSLTAIMCTTVVYGNELIGAHRGIVKRSLEKKVKDNIGKYSLNVTDSIITITSLDDNAVTETYYFNKYRACDAVEITAANKVGLEKSVDVYLHNPLFSFEKINDSLYVSKVEKKLVMEIKKTATNEPFAAIYKENKTGFEIVLGKKEEPITKL